LGSNTSNIWVKRRQIFGLKDVNFFQSFLTTTQNQDGSQTVIQSAGTCLSEAA